MFAKKVSAVVCFFHFLIGPIWKDDPPGGSYLLEMVGSMTNQWILIRETL